MEKNKENPEDDHPDGIPASNKIPRRRKYTISPAVIKQRSEAGSHDNHGRPGNKNAWKNGRYAKGMGAFLKPCKGTCKDYPCSYVTEKKCKIGSFCPDTDNLLMFFEAISQAMQAKDEEDREFYKEEVAMFIAQNFYIGRMLQNSVIEDGVNLLENDYDKDGTVIGQTMKLHPSLSILPKFFKELNISPADMMMTPQVIAKHKTEQEGAENLSNLLEKMNMPVEKKDDPGGTEK